MLMMRWGDVLPKCATVWNVEAGTPPNLSSYRVVGCLPQGIGISTTGYLSITEYPSLVMGEANGVSLLSLGYSNTPMR